MKSPLQQSKENMSAFLSNLEERRKSSEATARFRKSKSYIWGQIKNKKEEGARNAAEKVFLSIYNNALPIDANHRVVFESNLNNAIMRHVTESGASDVYDYLQKASKRGSIPAKTICESANAYMERACEKYYHEEDIDPDEIDTSKDSDIVTSAVVKITSDMNADEVSAAIENNVRATIAREMEISKQEDQKLADLEEQLANDDSVKEEADIDDIMYREGFGNKRIYKPTLFTGIMIGKVNTYTEEGELDGPEIQKKAFYESVKELTALQTLHTLGCIDINVNNVDKYARKYMAG